MLRSIWSAAGSIATAIVNDDDPYAVDAAAPFESFRAPGFAGPAPLPPTSSSSPASADAHAPATLADPPRLREDEGTGVMAAAEGSPRAGSTGVLVDSVGVGDDRPRPRSTDAAEEGGAVEGGGDASQLRLQVQELERQLRRAWNEIEEVRQRATVQEETKRLLGHELERTRRALQDATAHIEEEQHLRASETERLERTVRTLRESLEEARAGPGAGDDSLRFRLEAALHDLREKDEALTRVRDEQSALIRAFDQLRRDHESQALRWRDERAQLLARVESLVAAAAAAAAAAPSPTPALVAGASVSIAPVASGAPVGASGTTSSASPGSSDATGSLSPGADARSMEELRLSLIRARQEGHRLNERARALEEQLREMRIMCVDRRSVADLVVALMENPDDRVALLSTLADRLVFTPDERARLGIDGPAVAGSLVVPTSLDSLADFLKDFVASEAATTRGDSPTKPKHATGASPGRRANGT